MCQFRVCSCVLGHCTRSVGNAPLLFGCSAPYRVHRHVTGAVPLNGCSAPVLLAVVVAGDVGVFWAWVVFRLGCLPPGHFVVPLWRLMLWFLRNVARNSPTCISNIEITSLEFCGFLDTYEKLGYPNYVRVLVNEAPKANSCVRSTSHDTVHDPRDASTWRARLRLRGCGATRRTQLRMERLTVPPVGPNRAWRGATHRVQLPGSGPEELMNKAKCSARLP